jgi:hypothetical protein
LLLSQKSYKLRFIEDQRDLFLSPAFFISFTIDCISIMNLSSTSKKVNRFERHKKKFAIATTVIMLLLVELASYILVLLIGHQNQRQAYPYNRVISGYTVYRHTPGFDFGASTIRCSPDELTVAFDNNGFICDREVTVAKPKDTKPFINTLGVITAIAAVSQVTYNSFYLISFLRLNFK